MAPTTITDLLQMKVEPTNFNPYTHGMPIGSKDFIVTLSYDGRSMKVYQTTGPGVGQPTIEGVVDFLIDDVKEMLSPFDSKKADWHGKFDRNATEVRATNFATLLGGEHFAVILGLLGAG